MSRKLLILILFAFISITKTFGQQMDGAPVDTLSPIQIAAFREQAIKSINDLESYLKVVVNKKFNMTKRNTAMELALDLFQSDTTTVEVSSLRSSGTRLFTIRSYLAKLKILPYNSVKIDWYKIYLGNKFILGTDGNYYGTAAFLQRFQGISNREMGSYMDVTKRRITIILVKMTAYHGAQRIDEYMLKLGDIKVEETYNE